jgi:glycosyltransferase involved in cell wall biosynthesis
MRVAYIDELYKLVPNGGLAIWTKRLSNQLIEKEGLDINILTFSDDIETSIPDFLKEFPNVREIFIYPTLGERLLKKANNDYDLVQLVSPHTLIKGKSSKPTIISVHYLISRQALMFSQLLPWKYRTLFNFFSHRFFLHFERQGFQKADCITVSRKAYKDYLMEWMNIPEEKIRIVKYGIDERTFRPPDKKTVKERIALFVGRGSLPKGFDTLVEAASQIDGKVIAVATQIPEFIQKKISKLKNFQVLSGISQEKLVQLYQNASVYVIPSLCEGSPISTLEAMACGLPVVCTTEGSGDYIEHGVNGFIIPFKDAEKLAAHVNYLFEHRDIAVEFGSLNRRIVEEQLTLPVIARQIKEIYQHIAIKG